MSVGAGSTASATPSELFSATGTTQSWEEGLSSSGSQSQETVEEAELTRIRGDFLKVAGYMNNLPGYYWLMGRTPDSAIQASIERLKERKMRAAGHKIGIR